MRWQLNLYKDIAMRSEGPPDPERVVDRIQRISAAVFNLEQVGLKRLYTQTYYKLQVTLGVLVSLNICEGAGSPNMQLIAIIMANSLPRIIDVTFIY